MDGINDFGGGVKDFGRSVDYYKIIDERKRVGTLKTQSLEKSKEFQKLLDKPKILNNTISADKLQLKSKISKNSTLPKNVNNLSNVDGTDLARMKDVSKRLSDHFWGFYWNQVADGVSKNPEGGFGEEVFRKSLWPELVKRASGDELDEIGKMVLNDLLRQYKKNVNN